MSFNPPRDLKLLYSHSRGHTIPAPSCLPEKYDSTHNVTIVSVYLAGKAISHDVSSAFNGMLLDRTMLLNLRQTVQLRNHTIQNDLPWHRSVPIDPECRFCTRTYTNVHIDGCQVTPNPNFVPLVMVSLHVSVHPTCIYMYIPQYIQASLISFVSTCIV